MPVSNNSLDVADSSVSNPPNWSDVVQRAPVTYGRKRHALAEDGLTTVLLARDVVQASMTPSVIGYSYPLRIQPEPKYATERTRDDSPEFTFPWKKDLKEWDEQNDFNSFNENTQSIAEHSGTELDDVPETQCTTTQYSSDLDVSQKHHLLTDNIHEESSITEVMTSPSFPGGNLPRRWTDHRDSAYGSDSESELSHTKLGSSAHKSSPFSFLTPNSRSSPTPPTSDGEIPSLKGKSKGRLTSRRSVSPLYSGDEPSAMKLRNYQTPLNKSRKRAARLKPLTKKEQLETAKSSVRLAAKQHISIPKTEKNCKFTLQNFFTCLTENQPGDMQQASDPIVPFSSPSGLQPDADVSPFLEAGEDKLKELQARKQRLLTLQSIRTEVDEDADDLEIIADDIPAFAVKQAKSSWQSSTRVVALTKPKCLDLGPTTYLQHGYRNNRTSTKGKNVSTQEELSRRLAEKVKEENKRLTTQKDDEWIKSGGQLKTLLEGSQDALRIYAQRAIQNIAKHSEDKLDFNDLQEQCSEPSDYDGDEIIVDHSIHSGFEPDAKPTGTEIEGTPRIKMRKRQNITILDSDSELENHEEAVPSKDVVFRVGPRDLGRLPSPDGSDENSMLPPTLPHRGSVSSIDDQAEDRSDKENDYILMFDRSEDKENKATVRHNIYSSSKAFFDESAHSTSSGSLMDPKDLEDEIVMMDGKRTPLTVLSEDKSQASRPGAPPFQVRRSMSPAEITGNILSLSSVTKFDTAPFPQVSFTQLFESEIEKPKSSRVSKGKLTDKPLADLELTQDIELQPAFDPSNQELLRKAESIFEKEQVYMLEVGSNNLQKKQLYVNDFGFLTQTLPYEDSVLCKTSSIADRSPNKGSSLPMNDLRRHPLSTLSSLLAPELSEETTDVPRERRLIKRCTPSPSRSPVKADRDTPTPASRVIKTVETLTQGLQASRREKARNKLEKSEFVETEAEESDDDDVFGFLPKKDEEEDEENGNDLDQTLKTLVDDRVMDEETLNAPRVLEKFKEDMELQDQEVEKLHQAAIQGELRRKRRNRGIGLDDSDDESEDERARRIRRKMTKSQRIDRDTIKALAGNEETLAFYRAYENGILDDDSIETQGYDVVMGEVDNEDGQDTQDCVTRGEIQHHARELARRKEIEPTLDPHDVSWIDKDMSDEDTDMDIKVANAAQKTRAATRQDGLDFGHVPEVKKFPTVLEGEREKTRLQSWARMEGKSRNTTAVRSGGGVAVTGHAKNKQKADGTRKVGSTGDPIPQRHGRQTAVKAMPSILADVSDRSTRFK
ncbi:hypothetical protein APHAL10511_002064 [Amanita phalloides]|nr:hypothetical protein APHAL10511_002064 [Amanita phalloides]